MNQIKFLIVLVFPLVLSCSREEGCTDVDALNYNVESKKDDGSCTYLYLGVQGVYLDSASQLIQEPNFDFRDHKFILKITSNRYDGPEQFVLEYSTLDTMYNYTFGPIEDIIVRNEEWQIDLYLDDTSNSVVSTKSNIFSSDPNVLGWGVIGAGFKFIIEFRQ